MTGQQKQYFDDCINMIRDELKRLYEEKKTARAEMEEIEKRVRTLEVEVEKSSVIFDHIKQALDAIKLKIGDDKKWRGAVTIAIISTLVSPAILLLLSKIVGLWKP